MKIFFGKYSGSEISDLESSYLVQIIEKFDSVDWTVRNEAKKELAKRLSIPIETETKQGVFDEVHKHYYYLRYLEKLTNHLAKQCNIHSGILELFGITRIEIEAYFKSPDLIREELEELICWEAKKIPFWMQKKIKKNGLEEIFYKLRNTKYKINKETRRRIEQSIDKNLRESNRMLLADKVRQLVYSRYKASNYESKINASDDEIEKAIEQELKRQNLL